MFVTRLLCLLASMVNVLYATTSCSPPTRIEGFGRNPLLCVDDEVFLSCTAPDNRSTQLKWTTKGGSAYFNPSDTNPKTLTPFNLSLVQSTPILDSLAVTKAVQGLNGTNISCAETKNGAAFTEIFTWCFNFAAPPSDLMASLVECTTDSVTLQWNESSSDGGSNVTYYALTSYPPSGDCNGTCTVDPDTLRYTFAGLQPGVQYQLAVRGTNCGGKQSGTQSVVNVTVPISPPLNISVCSVYHAVTNQILQLSSTWTPLPMLSLNDKLQCRSPGNYSVTYTSDSDVQNFSVSASSCTPNCSHFLDVLNSNFTAYNVTIAAFGIPSVSKTVATSNKIFKVDVVDWTQSLTINCTFLSGHVGTSRCAISFGITPNSVMNTSVSTESGGNGQSVSVQMIAPDAPLDLNNSYYYEASLLPAGSNDQCVTIRGSLCALGYLGSLSTKNCSCSGGDFSVEIPNGCVCYSGITSGSQAIVQCDAGYSSVRNSTMYCQDDGLWSNIRPRCQHLTDLVAGVDERSSVIAGAVVGSVFGAFFILALLCVAAFMVQKHLSKNKKASKLGVGPAGLESSTELSSSISYPVNKVPQPTNGSANSEKEWASIMDVVREAAGTTNGAAN